MAGDRRAGTLTVARESPRSSGCNCEAADGVGAVELAVRLDPDVVLMDLRMPGGDGIEATRELTGRGLRCRVLVLTTYDTYADVIPAIRAGATGYLVKDASRDEVGDAVLAAAENRTVLSPSVASRLIARALFISEATVKTRLTHLYAKLGVSDRAAAVAVAYQRGILTTPG